MMESHEILNKAYSYLFYSASVFTLIASALSGNAYLIAATAVLLLLAAIYLNSGHIVNNLLIRHSSIIEIYNGYKASNSYDSAVKKVGNGYLSISAAVLILEKANEAGQEAMKNLIEGLHEPFRFGIALKEADKKRLVEELEVKRKMKEILLSRTDTRQYAKANELRREIGILDSDIENIRKGGKALDVIISISSFSRSESESEAAIESADSLRRVVDAFSAAFSIEYRILNGEKLLDFLEANP